MQLKDNRLLKMRKYCIIYLPIILMPVKLRVNSLENVLKFPTHPLQGSALGTGPSSPILPEVY